MSECSHPVGKCRHGIWACEGINKDEPTRNQYFLAHDASLAHTLSFLSDLEDFLMTGDPASDDLRTRYLKGTASRDLIFVIDITGSMGGEIDSVKAWVSNLIVSTESGDRPARFGDLFCGIWEINVIL